MNAGELVISLLLKAGGFKKDVEQAQHSLDSLEQKGKQSLQGVSAAAQQAGADAKKAGMTAAEGWAALVPQLKKFGSLIGAVTSVGAATKMFISDAAAIGRFSQQMGISVEQLQAWNGAVKTTGGSADAFQGVVGELTKKLTEAATLGTGEMIPLLEKLGLSAKDASGKTKNVLDFLPELAEKFAQMDKGTAQGLGARLGIDKGTIALLVQGRDAVEKVVKAKQSSIRFTKQDTEQAIRAQQAFGALSSSVVTLAMRAVAPIIPLMAKFAETIGAVAKWALDAQPLVLTFITVISAAVMAKAVPSFIALGRTIMGALAPLWPYIAAVTALSVAFDELWAFASGGDSVLERMLKRFGVSKEAIESFRMFVRKCIDTIIDLWTVITGNDADSSAAWNRIKETWASALAVLKGWIDKFKSWLAGLLPDWVKNMMGGGASEGQASSGFGDTSGVSEASGGGAVLGFSAQTAEAAKSASETAQLPKAGAAGPTNVDNSKTVTQNTSIGEVKVYTQAQDAEGVAAGMDSAIRNQTAQVTGAY